MVASKLHWRVLVAGVVALIILAFTAPAWVAAPDFDENRRLSRPPAWPTSLSGLGAFRKQADAWVADTFPPRTLLIAGLNRVRLALGVSGSKRVIVGRDGWLFYDDSSQLGGARADPPWGWSHTRTWLAHLAGRTEWLQARGIPYVVFVAPLKETVYPDRGPWWLTGAAPDHPAARMPTLVDLTQAGVLVSPSRELAAARGAGLPLYSRHDTHWTGYGAYVGYRALMARLHAMGLTEAPRPMSDFTPRQPPTFDQTPRDLARMLGVASLVDVQSPELVDLASLQQARTVWLTPIQVWNKPHIIETGEVGKPVLLITVDSFSNALLPFMYRHFSRIIVVHNDAGSWREDLVEAYRPDIVVLEVVEGGLKFSMRSGPPASDASLARIDRRLPIPMPGLTPMTPIGPQALSRVKSSHAGGPCSIDLAERRSVGEAGDAVLRIQGWVAGGDPRGFVRLQGPGADLAAPLVFRHKRPDVAAALKAAPGTAFGFSGEFLVSRAPESDWRMTVYRRSADGLHWRACEQFAPFTSPRANG